jgi:hypothetical protein
MLQCTNPASGVIIFMDKHSAMEFSMKFSQLALPLAVAASAFCSVAKADVTYYASVDMAQTACGADKVVWIDLDRGRYYKVGQGSFSKTPNGIYACEQAAHAKYREGKSDPTAVATK